jgi:hypothetical protein
MRRAYLRWPIHSRKGNLVATQSKNSPASTPVAGAPFLQIKRLVKKFDDVFARFLGVRQVYVAADVGGF